MALRALLALLTLTGAIAAHSQTTDRYVFLNVNVVPMDMPRVLTNQTVVVEQGAITAFGPADATFVPAGVERIDARGLFLMPGLAEMHGHLPQDSLDAEDTLFLYLAGGATTVRGMLGHPSQLEMRRRIVAGELLGPRLWLASPPLRGDTVPDVAAARRLVRQAADEGYDLLKIHEGLSAPVYDAVVDAAAELGLPFGGHVPDEVGVEGAFAAGQSTIDHLDNYLDALQPRRSPALAATGAERRRLLAVHANVSRIEDLAEETAEAGVAVVPTQQLWRVLSGALDPNELAAQPENRYMPRSTVDNWYRSTAATFNNTSRLAASREANLRQDLLYALHLEGVRILLGTDAPQVFSVPGFSLHREMPLMVEAGLSPFEVLKSGTVNVAAHFGIEDRAGTIAIGKNADLLLLEANPLDDIRAVSRIAGVMAAGRWLTASDIRARLDAIAARHTRQAAR